MSRCYYCGCEDPNHDKRCPVPHKDSSGLPKWHRGWSHGFKGSFCLYPNDSYYSLGYEIGKAAKEESDRRLSDLR